MKHCNSNWMIVFCIATLFISSCGSLNNKANLGKYNDIIKKYSGSIEKNSTEINYLVAESFRKSNRIEEAIPFYEKTIKGGIDEEEVYFYYALSLKSIQKYSDALNVLKENQQKISSKEVKEWVANEIENLENVDNLIDKKTHFRIKNLEELNTPLAEYGPVINNNYLYFTSNRNKDAKIYQATGTPFSDIYKVITKGSKIDMTTLEILPSEINDPKINEGSLAVGQKGGMIIFAKANSGKATGSDNVNLYFTRYRFGRWTEPKILEVSNLKYWDSTPAFSSDELTLYFASDRPGGYGGIDIYQAKMNRRGKWVAIKNLGPEINTEGNEVFPFVSSDGSLYFSSDGHAGLGKLDIFRAERQGGKVVVSNIGEPMNSSFDDFGYFEYDLTHGFFTSNRQGGKGDDDIYIFVNDDPDLKIVNYFLTGTTVSKDEKGNKITVSNSIIKLLDSENNVIDEYFTGDDGKFKLRVYAQEKYFLIAEKQDYFTTRTNFSTIGKGVNKKTLTEFITNIDFETEINLDRIMIEKTIVLNNIYYDLDKFNIRSDAAKVLDSLVVMLNDNAGITIELSSHTDDRADSHYNLELSQKRVEAAVNYIISKGIKKDRIVAKGYGETQLIIKNAQTEEEHQVNRRTEFKVINYSKSNIIEDLPVEDNLLDEYERFFNNTSDDGQN